MYDSADYAASRLAGTIIQLPSGEPVTVSNCEGRSAGILVHYNELINTMKDGRIRLKELDLTPVPLGFANTQQGVAYLARIPKRSDYRQGLRNSNYMSVYGVNHRTVPTASLYKTITNKYMDFEPVLDEVTNIGTTTAFNREFALARVGDDIKILYKWKGVVGDVVNGIPGLLGAYEYLQESLEEAV